MGLCLLRGNVLCVKNCKNKGKILTKDEDFTTGNLNKHANSKHAGQCIFIDTKIPYLIYVHFPKNVILKPIYLT